MKAIHTIISFILLLSLFSCVNLGNYNQVESEVITRDDGGYFLKLNGHTQIMQPVTVEGYFPKQPIHFQIELIGHGKDLTYRNQPGYFYSFPENIKSNKKHWDFGYAWVDTKREFIYLNFYWINSPDSVKESQINGRYKIIN